MCELFKLGFAKTTEELESVKKRLLEDPMTPDETVKLREMAMLMQRDVTIVDNLTTFPDRELGRLDEIAKEYPIIKARVVALDTELDGRR